MSGLLDGQVEHLGPLGDGGQHLRGGGALGVEREPLAQAVALALQVLGIGDALRSGFRCAVLGLS